MSKRQDNALIITSAFFITIIHLGLSQILFEGDICRDGRPVWRCRKLSGCPKALENLKKGTRPITCGYQGREPLVCCEPSNSQSSSPESQSNGNQRPWGVEGSGNGQGSGTRPTNSQPQRPWTNPGSGNGNSQWSGNGNSQWSGNRPNGNRPQRPWTPANSKPTLSFGNSNQPWSNRPANNKPTMRTTTRRPQQTNNNSNGLSFNNPPRPSSHQSSSNGAPPSVTPNTNSVTKRPDWLASKSYKMCVKYAESVYKEEASPVLLPGGDEFIKIDQCASSAQTLVVDGENAILSEFPHMAIIGAGRRQISITWFCGGSLISDRYVLSAAHCSNPSDKGSSLWARLGDLDIDDDFDGAEPVTLKIIKRIDHPKYDSEILVNDITLFLLEKSVEFTAFIRPICLPFRDFGNRSLIVTGWGTTSYGGPTSSILQKVKMTRFFMSECEKAFTKEGAGNVIKGVPPELRVCAGGIGRKDACQGDSGGPLQFLLKEPYCMYTQLGITSGGLKCGLGYPGLYTRIAHFISWIENIVWPD